MVFGVPLIHRFEERVRLVNDEIWTLFDDVEIAIESEVPDAIDELQLQGFDRADIRLASRPHPR